MNQSDEKQLLQRVAGGDHVAFAEIVRIYTPKIYPYLLYWVKDAHQAEELIQDVFIRIWDKRDKLSEVENFGGYIYITTRNIAVAALKKKLAGPEELNVDRLYNLTKQPTHSLELKELSAILNKAIDLLPPRRKEVFLLSRVDNLTYEAIAEKLQISRSAVRQHIVEALVFLRHYLKKHADVIINLAPWIVFLLY